MTHILPAAETLMVPDSTHEPGIIVNLTRGLAAGDEAAFREFHAAYRDRLHRCLLVIARGDETLARDALQETFIRVARHARVFASERVFWDWLVALGRSAVRDGGRKQSRYRRLLAFFASGTPAAPPGDGADSRDARLHELLAASLPELDPADAALLHRKYSARDSAAELARAHGTTEGTIESRLVRARRALRQILTAKLRHEEN